MAIVTGHWSVTGPVRLRDYHVEFGCTAVPISLNEECKKATAPEQIDWTKLESLFLPLYKNFNFDTATDYGTYRLNHDPRDGSPNIEVAALTMTGASTTGTWGPYPATYAHFWFMAGIIARICYLKNIDCQGTFNVIEEPTVLQNGPIHVVSTHGERAWQTQDLGADSYPERGYFIFSGDGDCRWDWSCADASENHLLNDFQDALASCKSTADKLRLFSHQIKTTLNEKSNFWGLDKDAN